MTSVNRKTEAPADVDLTDLEQAHKREAERRLLLLGNLACKEYEYQFLRERARRVLVPTQVMWGWWHAYHKQGLEGLLPSGWGSLNEVAREQVLEYYHLLSPLADRIEVDGNEVYDLAQQRGWSERTGMRWFQRYRIGGLWGLAPGYNPEQAVARKVAQPPVRAIGTLDNAAFEEIKGRLLLLGDDLLRPGHVSREEIKARAQEKGISESTLWSYRKNYCDYGLVGLAPQQRSDKGQVHGLSERMIGVVKGLRLSKGKRSVRAVHEEACERARHLGEREPSLWQVRTICAGIHQADLLLAQGDERRFRDGYIFSWDMNDANLRNWLIIYEIDHTPVDVLIKDERPESSRNPSGTTRPWLTTCIDRRSRLIMAAILAYERPNRHTVAAAIRDAVLLSDKKRYGGIPNEIWVDNGKELLSHHVLQLTQGLKIELHPCARHQPQQKGTEERFFGVLNTRHWARQPGYVGSNTTERLPTVKATLTLAELESGLRAFIEQYHNEEHRRLQYEGQKHTPLSYWQQYCWADPANPRDLDVLLLEPKERIVQKTGIGHKNRTYWHADLADLVRKPVIIRSAPNYAATYAAPDEIEVFHDGQWICTAFAVDSETGRAVTAQEIAVAKGEQRAAIRERIKQSRAVVEQADSDIKALKAELDAGQRKEQRAEQPSTPPSGEMPKQQTRGEQRTRSFFGRLGERDE